MKFDRSVTSPMVSDSVSATRSSRIRSTPSGDVRPGCRRALLALVLERAAHHRGLQHGGVGRGVRQDEVLAAGLADQPRVGLVRAMFAPTVCHSDWNVLVEPVKWIPARSGWVERDLGTAIPSPVTRLITPGGRPAASKQPHRPVRRELLRRRRLPDHRVAHQRRRGRQVAGDRGEVERRDRVDEALQRPVVDPVPHAGDEIGWSLTICRANATLNRRKSISSQAASISACWTVFD